MNRLLGAMALTCLGLVLPATAEVRVASADALKAAVNKPQPQYSSVARQMKVGGKVEVEVVITPQGNVESAKAITGNPLLTGPAVAAVQKWTFKPFTENGEPAKAVATLSFDFRP